MTTGPGWNLINKIWPGSSNWNTIIVVIIAFFKAHGNYDTKTNMFICL